MAKKLSEFPSVPLCHQPTPLEFMPRMSESLGGPRLWIKRDDCTGLATGGNKTRKLEFLIADAIEKGAEMLVTQGAVQSNHVRQTAAAACKFGLDCHALLERRVPDRADDYETTGNVLFDQMFGTSLEFRPAGLDMNAEAMVVTEKLAAAGRKPYFIPGGGSNEIGALGYVSCAYELLDQIKANNLDVGWIVLATGSAGTHAGMLAGLHAAGSTIPVMGISVRQPEEKQIAAVHKLAVLTASQLTDTPLGVEKVIVDDGYVGAGYGQPTQGTLDAINLIARREGLLFDPVYSGKGLAGMIGLAGQNFFESDKDVIFLHTGGAAALFAYGNQLAENAANG
ncbi:D-cysteine desulfhydrase [Alphaproteobacteria bacterium]|jgi:L-cysteate sulfo-lyase|nr:D-cysteine desulfhydrase [Alphaproteobacteria bacterium]MDC0966859.1 D-cysteine desulfhydrase [Alphaproteobacteria bacterium]